VLGEDFAGELFNFAERDCFEAARSFEAKAKPSNAGKKIKDAKFGHPPTPFNTASALAKLPCWSIMACVT
jgi:hypothetical protein